MRQIKYGSVNWGFLPFISDLKALLQSLRDLTSAAPGASCTTINRSRPIRYQKSFSDFSNRVQVFPAITSIDGNCRLKGVVYHNPPDLSTPISRGLNLLDELGFHPDLKTAWDIIPLSFVLDYFIPIGDILESLHPRGWQNNSHFEGSFSLSVNSQYSISYVWNGEQAYNFIPAIAKYYKRYSFGEASPISNVKWSSPSMKELFNTAYLTTSLKRVF